MHEETLVLMIPIVAILGAFAVAGFKLWIAHREKLEEMRHQRLERQRQADADLLSMGDPTHSAHIQVILDRLLAIERRLQGLETGATPAPPAVPAARLSPTPAPPIVAPHAPTVWPAAPAAPPPEHPAPDRRRDTELHDA